MTSKYESAAPPSYLFAAVGLLILSLALRPGIISIGPIIGRIQEAFDLNFAQASMLTSIPDLCMGFLALLSPLLAKRLGTNVTIVSSLLLLGAGILLRSQAQSVCGLLLATFVVGVGIAVAGSMIGGWIKQFYSDHAAMFMGIYSTGLSLGATAAAAGTDLIATKTGSWRLGAGIWSILCISAVVSWVVMGRSHRVIGTDLPRKAPAKLPWNTAKAWVVAVYFGCSQFLGYAMLAWLAPSMQQMQSSAVAPGYLLSAFTLIFTAANFTTGAIAGNASDRRILIALSSCCTVIGLAGLAFIDTVSPLVFIALTSIGLGAAFTLGMTLPLDHTHSPEQASAWTVFTLFIGYVIAAAGPFSFGMLRDLSGSFFAPYLLLMAVAGVMLTLTPFLKPIQLPLQGPAATPLDAAYP